MFPLDKFMHQEITSASITQPWNSVKYNDAIQTHSWSCVYRALHGMSPIYVTEMLIPTLCDQIRDPFYQQKLAKPSSGYEQG